MLPQYMHKFRCVGSECEDTCCAGWSISVEKEAYKRYQNVKDKELQQEIKSYIQKTKDSKSDYDYAVIKLDKNGMCGFLTKEKLCGLQLKLGEQGLCQTCDIYPKVYNAVDHTVELSSKMSCPESARLALLNRDPMEFDVIDRELGYSTPLMKKVITNQQNTLEYHFWDIRIFVISLLQNRLYKLQDRLFILGWFCSKLDEQINNNSYKTIPSLIDTFKRQIDTRYFDTIIRNVRTDMGHVTISLLKEMTSQRAQSTMLSRYQEVMNRSYEALKLNGNDEQEIKFAYTRGLDNYFTPLLDQHGYILENYLVNFVFEDMFLFQTNSTAMQQYLKLMSLYSMVKFHIVGVGLYEELMTPERAVYIIQAFARNVEHSKLFINWLVASLEKAGVQSMALMSIIIMN
jgi:lysine-N-methylase